MRIVNGQWFPPGSTILWGEVQENFGGGYNETTGEFVAPLVGTYRFTVTVMNKAADDRAVIQIIHNDVPVCAALAAGEGDRRQFAMCSQVVRLAAGDEVSVVNPHWASTEQYQQYHTVFEGLLLLGEL